MVMKEDGKSDDSKAVRELAQKMSEQRYRLIFKNAPLGLVNFDTDGVITDCNDNFVNIIGSSRDKLLGLKILNLPDKKLVAAVKKALKDGSGYYKGYYHSVTADKITPVRILFTSIKDGAGKAIGGLGIIEDVTKQTRTEKALINAKEEAQASNRAKSEFLANMSHELRTPLNGIIGFSELLKNTPLEPEQSEFVEIVISSAKGLLAIISDILDLSKIEAGKLELMPEKTNLRELINSTTGIVALTARKKGVKLYEAIDKTIPAHVMVDPMRLKQILLNLLSNAVKFTEKGQVELTISKQAVDSEKRSVRLFFSVRDTGIGIKQEHRGKLFKPFSQVDMSTTREYGGTGLGLAITNRLLKKMGSKLQLESTFGKGSTFSFELGLPFYE